MAVALLQAADAVLEAGGAGDRPRAGQGLLVAQVGPEVRLALAVLVDGSWLGPVAKAGSIAGRSSSSGIRHGSEPLARKPSESSITGVR